MWTIKPLCGGQRRTRWKWCEGEFSLARRQRLYLVRKKDVDGIKKTRSLCVASQSGSTLKKWLLKKLHDINFLKCPLSWLNYLITFFFYFFSRIWYLATSFSSWVLWCSNSLLIQSIIYGGSSFVISPFDISFPVGNSTISPLSCHHFWKL